MKFGFLTSRVALAAALLAIGGFAHAQSAPHAKDATKARPPILAIDRQAIMKGSKLGQDIHRQIMAYEDKVESDLGAQGQALQNEMQAFQQQSPSLPPAERDKKKRALQTKEAAYRQKVQARQSLIQGGELAARQRYLSELAAVVEAIMLERGAEMVVEKSTIVASVGGLDITNVAMQRLDRRIASFKVPLVNPPASSQTQFQ